MIIGQPCVKGRFIKRINRFAVVAEIDGCECKAHLPNSGRLGELLLPGRQAAFLHRPSDHRTTDWDMVQILHEGHWVSTDARLPNRLVGPALQKGMIPGIEPPRSLVSEPTLGSSRLDFRLEYQESPPAYLEVKSVTLVENGTARFPDAPTLRGTRHVRELIDYCRTGGTSALLFVVQRNDALRFSPVSENDPSFAEAVKKAIREGVRVLAMRCDTEFNRIDLKDQIDVYL